MSERFIPANTQSKFAPRSTADSVLRVSRQIAAIAQHYMRGDIRKTELEKEQHPRMLLKELLELPVINKRDSLEAAGAIYFSSKTRFDHSVVFELLKRLNQERWQLDQSEIEALAKSFNYLPGSDRTAAQGPLSEDEAFAFASHHHAEHLGSFLQLYREARGITKEQVGKIQHKGEEAIRHQENRETHRNGALLEIAKDPSNPWSLPLDSNSQIRPDVWEHMVDVIKRARERPIVSKRWVDSNKAEELSKKIALEIESDEKRASVQPKLQKLKQHLLKEQRKYPDEPFPLITLPDGEEMLARMDHGNMQLPVTEFGHWLNQYLTQQSNFVGMVTGEPDNANLSPMR